MMVTHMLWFGIEGITLHSEKWLNNQFMLGGCMEDYYIIWMTLVISTVRWVRVGERDI